MAKASSLPPLRGILMDMDGVVVDSEPILLEAVSRLFAEKGVSVEPADCQPFFGTGEDHLLEGVAAKHGVTLGFPRDLERLYALYLELIPGRLKALPGVYDFLAEARRRRLKVALASSAAPVKVEHNLREIGLMATSFDAVVDAKDVQHKKPHPDIFLTAAQRLGQSPAACLVVEDAVAGVEAAKAAGCRCLALTTSFPAERLTAADWVVPDLAHIPPEVWGS
jgi:beta-phosphoglucomutase